MRAARLATLLAALMLLALPAGASRPSLVFVPNVGQAPADVLFVTHGESASWQFDRDGLLLPAAGGAPPVRLSFLGADPPRGAFPAAPRQGVVNFYFGQDPGAWRAGVPTYARLVYPDVYPGVDVEFHGHRDGVEYDLVLAPGAVIDAVALTFTGAEEVREDGEGGLVVCLPGGGELRQRRPQVFQRCGDAMHSLPSAVGLDPDGRVTFSVERPHPSLPLVIDPVIAYATYLGGSNEEFATGAAVDATGKAVVVGYTQSALDFPCPGCTFHGGVTDAFVVQLMADASDMVYATFLGGSDRDDAHVVTLGPDGAAYVAGRSNSLDLPVTANAPQPANRGGHDAFLARLDPQGRLDYATYLGGAGEDFAFAVAVDPDGDVYLGGFTESGDFPLASPLPGQDVLGGTCDAFLARFGRVAGGLTGGDLKFSTYLGGSGGTCSAGSGTEQINGLAAQAGGQVLAVGSTPSSDFPTTAGSVQPLPGGGIDTFIARVDTGTPAMVAATYLGGSDNDSGLGLATDAAARVYLAGTTGSDDFPVKAAVQPRRGGGVDAFLACLAPGLDAIQYATYLGGSGAERTRNLTVEASGHAYFAGATASRDLPLERATGWSHGGGGDDCFVATLTPAGQLLYGTYLGGSGDEDIGGLARDRDGNLFVSGYTNSTDLPVTPGVFQPAAAGLYDAFVAQVRGIVVSIEPIPGRVNPGEPLRFLVKLRNEQPVAVSSIQVEVILDTCLDLSGFDPARDPGDVVVTPGPSFPPAWTFPTLTVVLPSLAARGQPGSEQAITISDVAKNAQDPECCTTARISHQVNPNLGPVTAIGCLAIGGCGACAEPACVDRLTAVRSGSGSRSDVSLGWEGAAGADHYHAWKAFADPALIPRANQYAARGEPAIAAACAETAGTACTDPGAVTASPRLVFYQARGACTCTPAVHLEGIGHPPEVSCR